MKSNADSASKAIQDDHIISRKCLVLSLVNRTSFGGPCSRRHLSSNLRLYRLSQGFLPSVHYNCWERSPPTPVETTKNTLEFLCSQKVKFGLIPIHTRISDTSTVGKGWVRGEKPETNVRVQVTIVGLRSSPSLSAAETAPFQQGVSQNSTSLSMMSLAMTWFTTSCGNHFSLFGVPTTAWGIALNSAFIKRDQAISNELVSATLLLLHRDAVVGFSTTDC
jgi:hypothetical protein